jgi:hypothetical protein
LWWSSENFFQPLRFDWFFVLDIACLLLYRVATQKASGYNVNYNKRKTREPYEFD